MSQAAVNERPASPNGWLNRFLNGVEKAGNKLPDPAMLFLYALLIVWVGSWIGSQFSFDLVNPRTGEAVAVTAKSVPSFKPGKELRERINKPAAPRPALRATNAA